MNIIGIDPSLNSTGLVINGKVFNFTKESYVYGKTTMKKWYKYGEPYINYHFISHNNKDGVYAKDEIIKMVDYDKITSDIVEIILSEINKDDDTVIGIESYSYNSAAGDIIDLVTFSTTLRIKLFQQITENLIIIPPSSLKKEAGKMTYPEEKKGKNIVYRNNFGLASGHFQKKEMYLSLIENKSFTDNYVQQIKELKEDFLSVANFPSPFSDTNDAFIIYKHLQSLGEIEDIQKYYKLFK